MLAETAFDKHMTFLPSSNAAEAAGMYSTHLYRQTSFSSAWSISDCRGGPWARDQLILAKKEELIAELKGAGIEVEAEAPMKLLGYYPPFAPRWIRLQEILLPVKNVD